MKILFLTPQLPFPLTSGGVFKTYRVLEDLSQHHDLALGCFLKGEDAAHLEEFKNKKLAKTIFTQRLNKNRNGINFLLSIIKRKPLSVFRNESKIFFEWVQEEVQKADVIFIDHFLMFQYVPDNFKKKVIFHEHNAEYIMWERFAAEGHWPKSLVYLFEAWRIRNYERSAIEKSTTVFAAPNDILELQKIAPGTKYRVTYHLGDDQLLLEPSVNFDERKKQLLYIGTLTWEANKDGLLWFLKAVWPQLKAEEADLQLIIIGKKNDEDFSDYLNDNQIFWKGFVDDLKTFYSQALVFIAPLRFGSGIKVKNVNAMYRGIPVVTTSIGVEGLDVVNAEHVMIADQAEDFKKCIQNLIHDKQKWNQISAQSRNFSKEHLSWDKVLRDIREVFE